MNRNQAIFELWVRHLKYLFLMKTCPSYFGDIMAEVCSRCGLPVDLCVCEELEKDQTRIVVRLEMRRFRKPTTLIEGFNPKRTDLERLTKKLKGMLACGGTAKEGYVLLQGDHRNEVKDRLVNLGFSESSIEIQ